MSFRGAQELSGRVLDSRSRVWASPEALCCVLEQDTLSSAKYWVQPRKTSPDMTEELLTQTGT